MKYLKNVLDIPLEYMEEENNKKRLEIEAKIKVVLEIMAMRLVLNSYQLPENIDFVVNKLKTVYNNIAKVKSVYLEAIKNEEYTDSVIFYKDSLLEHENLFFDLTKELYNQLDTLDEVPICIRENFDLLKVEISKLDTI